MQTGKATKGLRAKALDVVKYGNDDDYVDSIARDLANHYYPGYPLIQRQFRLKL